MQAAKKAGKRLEKLAKKNSKKPETLRAARVSGVRRFREKIRKNRGILNRVRSCACCVWLFSFARKRIPKTQEKKSSVI
jgi:hypothetical protein